MDANTFFKKLETMTDKEAFEKYDLNYYTLTELLDDKTQGKDVQKLFEKNYML